MRPTPIPDEEVWEGAVRKVIAPPSGDLTDTTIAPVEALVDQSGTGYPRFSMRCALEDGDLEVLRAGGVVWVSMLGEHLHPFSVDVAGAISPEHPSLRVDVDMHDPGEAPTFNAYTHGVSQADSVTFVRGCIEALEVMLGG
jgi:hypothetical protein